MAQPRLGDDDKRLSEVHDLAPYNLFVSYHIVTHTYNKKPTYEEASVLYERSMPFSSVALWNVADTLKRNPERYEEMMQKAGELTPIACYDLGTYFTERKQKKKAMSYLDKAADNDTDPVKAAAYAHERINYYLKEGETNRARKIADEAGDSYSASGLAAKAGFLESVGELDKAFEWYDKIVERYDDSDYLVSFCGRHVSKTGHTDLDQEVHKTLETWVKKMKKVTLGDFKAAPDDGVEFFKNSKPLAGAGLKKGDVVVAVDGMRVHSVREFSIAIDIDPVPTIALIVWQDGQFREINASPPNHKFEGGASNYKAR